MASTRTVRHSGHREATEEGFKRCDLWTVAELQKDCILIKDQREKCDIEAEEGAQGNDLNAVNARNADPDSEDARHYNVKQ